MYPSTAPPPAVWRWLGLTAVVVLLGSVLAIALISAGLFDPMPIGSLVTRRSLEPVIVPAGEKRIDWLADSVPKVPFSARLSASLQGGEQDIAYGIAVAGQEGDLFVAISPLGYAAIWLEENGEQQMLFPWQPWPHVRLDESPNEIQLDIYRERVEVRVNREFLWEGVWMAEGDVGLFVRSFGEAAIVDFLELRIYSD